MKQSFNRKPLSLALATTLAAGIMGSANSYACAYEPMISSICIMAAVNYPGSFNNGTYLEASGQVLNVNQNAALYSLLGNTYGGSGTTTFALPDLRGRVVVGAGQAAGRTGFQVGQSGGADLLVLKASQLPTHAHQLGVSVNVAAQATGTPVVSMSPTNSANLTGVGALQNSPISTMPPYLAMRYYIAVQGVYPTKD